MFGILEKYKSKDFYNDHRIIKFITKNEILEYEIIYIFKTSASNGFDYYKYIDFNDVSEFNTFTNKCKELAFYNTETESNYGEQYGTIIIWNI